jgi:hypothetical protein
MTSLIIILPQGLRALPPAVHHYTSGSYSPVKVPEVSMSLARMGDAARRLFIGQRRKMEPSRRETHSVAILIIKLQLSQPKYTQYLLFGTC